MPSDGASDDHGDDGDDHKMIKCSTWKRRKRKTKPYGDQGKGIAQGFGFGDSALFDKMKCIFSIAPVGKLEKSREHRTLRLCVQCSQCLAQPG